MEFRFGRGRKVRKGYFARAGFGISENGFGGFHIHVRTGLDDQYLGTEYMEAVSTVVEKAKECELKAWLYDEDRWASGAAGGFVTKEQKYRQKYLLFTPFSYDEVGPSAPPEGLHISCINVPARESFWRDMR